MPYENAGYSADAPYNPKNLLAETDGITTRKVVILAGQSLVAGAVIGVILAAASATVTAGTPVSGSGGTVGNGAVGAWTSDAGAPEGTYRIVISNPATDAGKYEVFKPDGTLDGVGTVGVAYNGTINGTLADGSADWVEDDYIPVTVSYASGLKHKLSLAAATDGSQTPNYVLAQDVDASGGDTEAIAYETATVVATALTLGAGHTVASIREGLRRRGIKIDD